jgi:hypothetical protein
LFKKESPSRNHGSNFNQHRKNKNETKRKAIYDPVTQDYNNFTAAIILPDIFAYFERQHAEL